MPVRRPWLLVFIPAMSGVFAAAFTVLLRVREIDQGLASAAIGGTLVGLFPAMWLALRPATPRPP